MSLKILLLTFILKDISITFGDLLKKQMYMAPMLQESQLNEEMSHKLLRIGTHNVQDCQNFERSFLCIRKCLNKGYHIAYADRNCYCTCYKNKEKSKWMPKHVKLSLTVPPTEKPYWVWVKEGKKTKPPGSKLSESSESDDESLDDNIKDFKTHSKDSTNNPEITDSSDSTTSGTEIFDLTTEVNTFVPNEIADTNSTDIHKNLNGTNWNKTIVIDKFSNESLASNDTSIDTEPNNIKPSESFSTNTTSTSTETGLSEIISTDISDTNKSFFINTTTNNNTSINAGLDGAINTNMSSINESDSTNTTIDNNTSIEAGSDRGVKTNITSTNNAVSTSNMTNNNNFIESGYNETDDTIIPSTNYTDSINTTANNDKDINTGSNNNGSNATNIPGINETNTSFNDTVSTNNGDNETGSTNTTANDTISTNSNINGTLSVNTTNVS